MKRILIAIALLFILAIPISADRIEPQSVSFPTSDGGQIFANIYGKGGRGVVLAHGGQFNKDSWEMQAQQLVAAGFRVLALDFRGYGRSRGPGQADPMSAPLHLDVLAAVQYLRKNGAKTISIIGASMGGHAAADASIQSKPGDVDRLVLLASSAGSQPEKLKGRKLFIIAREDTRGDGVVRLVKIQEQYERAPDPKELIILEGSAHAQFLFQTDQSEKLTSAILKFLSAP